MKKIGICVSIIILLITISIAPLTYAVGETLEINLTGTSQVEQNGNSVELILSLSNVTGFPEEQQKPVIGYEAILDYDESIFSSAEVETLNNWSINYEPTTKRITGLIDAEIANQQITKITLTLNENVEPGTTTVRLTNGLLTVYDEFDFEFEKEVTVTIAASDNTGDEENPEENNTANESTDGNIVGNETENTAGSTTNNTANTTNTSISGNQDRTTASNSLPKTGMGKIALIVVLVLIIGIGCFARYKSIKLK